MQTGGPYPLPSPQLRRQASEERFDATVVANEMLLSINSNPNTQHQDPMFHSLQAAGREVSQGSMQIAKVHRDGLCKLDLDLRQKQHTVNGFYETHAKKNYDLKIQPTVNQWCAPPSLPATLSPLAPSLSPCDPLSLLFPPPLSFSLSRIFDNAHA